MTWALPVVDFFCLFNIFYWTRIWIICFGGQKIVTTKDDLWKRLISCTFTRNLLTASPDVCYGILRLLGSGLDQAYIAIFFWRLISIFLKSPKSGISQIAFAPPSIPCLLFDEHLDHNTSHFVCNLCEHTCQHREYLRHLDFPCLQKGGGCTSPHPSPFSFSKRLW